MYNRVITIPKIINCILLLLVLFLVSNVSAQKMSALKFNKDAKFKIVQFTDVHFKVENKLRSDSVLTTMKTILANEKPDLVVLTGDVSTSEKVKESWATVIKPMVEAKIPWAAVFGNHDHEHGFTNSQIMDYLLTLPYNYSQMGPKNISGAGNYVLEIKGNKDSKTKALLYCFDSNAYTANKKDKELGEYGWIKFDQIQWYREKSKQLAKKNNGVPYPALAFFHIPLPEYKEIKIFKTTVGDREEDVCSPQINSGMYNAMLESQDVMGTFCGHDHNNNYIGTLNNIALAYGCKTGKDSYGKNEKGGRVIVLYEGERKFDTWITTPTVPQKYFVSYPESFKK